VQEYTVARRRTLHAAVEKNTATVTLVHGGILQPMGSMPFNMQGT